MKYTVLSIIALFFFCAAVSGQQEMTYKDWESAVSESQKKEQAAKEKIAEEQAKVTTIKEQIKETKKKAEQTRAEILSTAGTTEELVDQWNGNVNTLLGQVEAFNSLMAQDKISRQMEIPAFESQSVALKQDHAALLTASQAQLSVLDNAIDNAKNGVVQAQKDVMGAAEAAKMAALSEKQRKIEEARMAKEEAKRKAEEEKQAKLQAQQEAKQKAEEERQVKQTAREQAQAEAKQKAEEERQAKQAAREQAKEEAKQKAGETQQTRAAQAADGDLVAGTTYRVKDLPDDRETLSKMALRLYGDPKLWTKIYDANKDKIDAAYAKLKRRSPEARYKEAQDYIYPGLDLVLPK